MESDGQRQLCIQGNEDVRRQKGFITADIEYTGYKHAGFYSSNEEPTEEETNYYKDLTKVIQQPIQRQF